MEITKNDIELYLKQVKNAIIHNRYRIATNKNRQCNLDLFLTYILDERGAKDILLSLKVEDFSEILSNHHKGFEHELLYVFGKDVELIERLGSRKRVVSLYIKFNKLKDSFVIVISLHEQKRPLNYYFR